MSSGQGLGGLGFQGAGCGVSNFGVRVCRFEFRVWCWAFGLEFMVQGSGIETASATMPNAQCIKIRILEFGIRADLDGSLKHVLSRPKVSQAVLQEQSSIVEGVDVLGISLEGTLVHC